MPRNVFDNSSGKDLAAGIRVILGKIERAKSAGRVIDITDVENDLAMLLAASERANGVH